MAAAIESYDTQMDYDFSTDIDVQMHTSGAESWFQNEDIMDDGSRNFHEHEGSVEVEMEPYQENAEFEMADGMSPFAVTVDAEIVDVDVDVVDVSHSDTLHVDHTSPSGMASPMRLQEPASEITEYHQPSTTSHPQLGVDTLHDSGPLAPDSIVVTEASTSEEIQSGVNPNTEGYQVVAFDYADGSTVGVEVVLPENSATQTTSEVDHETTQDNEDPTSLQHDAAQSANYISQIPQAEEVPADDLTAHQHDSEVYGEGQTAEASSETAVPESYDHDHYDEVHGAESTDAENTDPHEISEGVYIDPPPAVVLYLPTYGESTMYLFNLPSRSGSATPSSPLPSESTILLHHRPILYYEPLSSLFDALRNDEHLSGFPDLSKAELVLDAYDLQLVVSEDNMYAREVTLHDLNVIHDGCHLNGPLRLRLQSKVPRFIVRLHSLQQQLNGTSIEDTGPAGIAHKEQTTSEAPLPYTENYEDGDTLSRPHEPLTSHENAESRVDDDSPDTENDPEVEEYEQDDYGNEANEPDATEDNALTHATEPEDLQEPDEDDISENQEERDELAQGQQAHGGFASDSTSNAAEAVSVDETHSTGNDQDTGDQDGDPADESVSDTSVQDAETVVPQLSAVTKNDEASLNDNGDENQASGSAPSDHTTIPDQTNPTDTEWDDTLDADGDPEEDPLEYWDAEQENDLEHETESAESSVTLSSKRSYHDLEADEYDPELHSPYESPGSKRPRTE